MKKVMVFGTFDIFHKGHEDFFRQAREFGEYLIVIVARDENVLRIKGKSPRNNEIFRRDKIAESTLADEVVLGNLTDKFKVIQQSSPDIICLGYDQMVLEYELKKKLIEFSLEETKIIRLNPFFPETYKSSKLKD